MPYPYAINISLLRSKDWILRAALSADGLSTSRPQEGQKVWHLMANTYSQIYIQTVFAVSGRLSLISKDFKEDLHKYISGIVKKKRKSSSR